MNVNGTPDYGAPARLDDARFLLPVLGVPPPNNAASTRGRTRHLSPGRADAAVAAGRPSATGPWPTRRTDSGAASR
ncbi:putative secreted protein [Mycobacteroides abscessus subsp. abscessus]|nr:putative secreted protein [Mycobacteroides abscessus subsp. abscessus]